MGLDVTLRLLFLRSNFVIPACLFATREPACGRALPAVMVEWVVRERVPVRVSALAEPVRARIASFPCWKATGLLLWACLGACSFPWRWGLLFNSFIRRLSDW